MADAQIKMIKPKSPCFESVIGLLVIGFVAIAIVAAICGFVFLPKLLDLRPANLTGSINCDILERNGKKNPEILFVLDPQAVAQRSRFEIVSQLQETPEPGWIGNRVSVDFGAADGSITGCGGPEVEVIRFDVTGQMISYPSVLRVKSYAPVTLTITDSQGNPLANSMTLTPGQTRSEVEWTR